MAHGRRALTMALFLSTAIAPAAPGEAGAEPENGTAEDRNRSRREQPALAVGGRVRVTSSVLERRAEGFVESMDEAALRRLPISVRTRDLPSVSAWGPQGEACALRSP